MDSPVATSQPFQDGDEVLSQLRLWPRGTPSSSEASRILLADFDSESEFFVGTSQACEDSDDDCGPMTPVATPPEVLARRARLIRRASPVKPRSIPPCPRPRPTNLVRRVTADAEMERKRQHVRAKTTRVLKKLCALATKTFRLQRKHRELCKFLVETRKNKVPSLDMLLYT
ncbi:hypothetical protein C8R43DRAFT_1143755 [Mycena crocata]|nr:hypothetical protein C8R43DRAFT_1143755 [Mycena crocata]